MFVPSTLDDITPDWLSGVLSASGAMPDGSVSEVALKAEPRLDELRVGIVAEYDGPVPLTLPRFYTLRCSLLRPALLQADWMREETNFCRLVAPRIHTALANPPVPMVYGSGYERQSGRGFILNQDVTHTHTTLSGPLPPTLAFMRQAVDALAAFHAYWWDHQDLGELCEPPNSREEESYTGQLVNLMPEFLDAIAEVTPISFRHLLMQAIEDRIALIPRILSGSNWSVRNSAPLASRFAYPLNDQTHGMLLTYWAYWTVSAPAHDLCCLIGCSLPAEQRRRQETYLVRRYWQGLIAGGVKGYSWRQCWFDYGLYMASVVFTPVWRWISGYPTQAWWPLLLLVLEAYQDLRRPSAHYAGMLPSPVHST